MARSSTDAVFAKVPKGPEASRRARGAFARLLRRFASRSDSGSSRATFEKEPSLPPRYGFARFFKYHTFVWLTGQWIRFR